MPPKLQNDINEKIEAAKTNDGIVEKKIHQSKISDSFNVSPTMGQLNQQVDTIMMSHDFSQQFQHISARA